MHDFSSAGLPASDRQAGYEAALLAYFPDDDYVDKHIRLQVSQPESFAAIMQPITLGDIQGGYHMSNAPHSLYLAPSDTRSGDVDFYLMLEGEITFQRADGPVRLRSGEMTLMRSSDELSSVSSRMEMIVLCLPERLVHCRLDGHPLALNRTMSGMSRLGACLGAMLRTAAQYREEVSVQEGLVLQSSIVDAVLRVAAMDGETQGPAAPQPEAKLRLLQRSALNLLRHPDLTPLDLALDAGVSVRTVHRLFQGSGVTFREWLRERRLERCWEELTNPAGRNRTVADVAFRWGFNDLTTFNRSFRAKYGVPPTAVRSAGLQ